MPPASDRTGRERARHRVLALAAATSLVAALLAAGGVITRDDVAAAGSPPRTAAPAAAIAMDAAAAARRVPLTVLALGDSVPAGKACGCHPYVDLVAARLASATGRPVTADNDAVSGYDSADLRRALRRSSRVRHDVARAGLILVTVGANDLGYRGDSTCGTDLRCYTRDLAAMERRVDVDLTLVRGLAGRRATVMVTGYWNVWQDGAVAARAGSAFVRTSRLVTRAANLALARVSARRGARYVDLLTGFRPGDKDDTALLAPDGDHPNAAGHRLIASVLLAALPRPLARIGR